MLEIQKAVRNEKYAFKGLTDLPQESQKKQNKTKNIVWKAHFYMQ